MLKKTNHRIIHVKEDFSTIQDAINNASAGDTIFVSKGVYYEHVIVNKTLSLVGENNTTTIIDGSNNDTVVQITADDVSISGFKLQNSGYGWVRHGIYVYKADNCEIKNNWLFDDCHNIRINYSRNSRVLENTINGTTTSPNPMYGIRLENSAGCVAIGNRVSVRVGGIHLENATNCTVKGNYLTQNDQGIRLYSPCINNMIIANTVENNKYDGIITPMPENTTFANNSFLHNNFVNNSNPFIVQSSGTIWDNGFEGNYWSRYTGIDADQNGVGDIPINIGQDQDHYPLMGRFSEFSFQSKGKTYTVPLVCNRSIIDFKFESANNGSTIGFGILCETEAAGFCRIAIPSELMSPPFTLLVDNSPSLNDTLRILYEGSDNVYTLLHFTYPEGSHRIAVVADSSLPSISTAFIPVLFTIPAFVIGLGATRSEGFAICPKRSKTASCTDPHRTYYQ